MTTEELGVIIHSRRKELRLTQREAAQGCHVGTRFLSDLENGKETVELGKTLNVIHGLGLQLRVEEM
ncbi:MAG: helix-turn-helix transcriptional regulator [Spirochaetales bacterium]|nr:helix-turn-helix transcriptional regulator [Candidatus Physcosoma equi]